RQTIDGFDRNLAATARRSEELAQGLDDLPATLRVADKVLGRVPGTAAVALPLLRDLLPAAQALPAVAADLRPFLAELRPTLVDLRPALASLVAVLDETHNLADENRRLLDKAHAVVPPTTAVLSSLLPAIDFLRPYTPELAGLIANLASASANYDANGHFLRVWTTAGTSTLIGAPALSPLVDQIPDRRPGELEGQPITDATGSPVR
ncbi:MAG: MlaD family protein, partial [Acidimicrobiia bacterium]